MSEKTDKDFTGNKYVRKIRPFAVDTESEVGDYLLVDVYCVLDAFEVTNPAVAHAVKKLLCAGLRGKNDRVSDLKEAADAIRRAVVMEGQRPSGPCRKEMDTDDEDVVPL